MCKDVKVQETKWTSVNKETCGKIITHPKKMFWWSILPEERTSVVQTNTEHSIFPYTLFVYSTAKDFIHHLQNKHTDPHTQSRVKTWTQRPHFSVIPKMLQLPAVGRNVPKNGRLLVSISRLAGKIEWVMLSSPSASDKVSLKKAVKSQLAQKSWTAAWSQGIVIGS